MTDEDCLQTVLQAKQLRVAVTVKYFLFISLGVKVVVVDIVQPEFTS